MPTQKPPFNRDLPTGYEGSIPEDISIPNVGMTDIDVAVFDLFDSANPIYAKTRSRDSDEVGVYKVPVFFAAGERFAIRDKRFRDKSGALITPMVAIRRTGMNQAKENMGSIIGQDTGDYVIKRKISSRDPDYQNIINRLGIKNQDNVASDKNFTNQTSETGNISGRLASRRDRKNPDVRGHWLDDDKSPSHIYETIKVPFPVRMTLTYEVVMWSTLHMQVTDMLHRVISNYDGQGRSFVIETRSGYKFVAYLDDDIQYETNVDDYTGQERVYKNIFTMQVPCFIFSKNYGDSVPIRRQLSQPQISFGVYDGDYRVGNKIKKGKSNNPDDFIYSNIKNIDLAGNVNPDGKSFFQESIVKDPVTGKNKLELKKIKYRNARSGETVVSNRKLFDIDEP